ALDRTTGITYVLRSRRGKWSIQEQISELLARCIELWHPQRVPHIGVESNAYQKVLKPLLDAELRKAGMSTMVVQEIMQGRTDKHTRIRRLFPDIQHKHLLFLFDDEGHKNAIDQMLVIARGGEPNHDDDADA